MTFAQFTGLMIVAFAAFPLLGLRIHAAWCPMPDVMQAAMLRRVRYLHAHRQAARACADYVVELERSSREMVWTLFGRTEPLSVRFAKEITAMREDMQRLNDELEAKEHRTCFEEHAAG